MAKYQVQQIRSGEGWILTDPSNLGAEVLASDMKDALAPVLLVASEEFESWTPPGGEQVEADLYAFRGEAALAMLRDWQRWGRRRAIFAALPALPDEDARRRWIADALRPWDPERLKATVYGQLGADWAQRGLWFASERERARFIELSVTRLLGEHGVAKLPNGDVTLVLEMPTDSSFEAEYKTSGSGESFAIGRTFPSRMVARKWFIRRGDWEGEETRLTRATNVNWRRSITQGLAGFGIILLSIPMFLMVVLVAIVTKLSGSSTSVSATSERVARKT